MSVASALAIAPVRVPRFSRSARNCLRPGFGAVAYAGVVTAADSGGWGKGTSTVIDLMGYNYYEHGNTDEQHKDFPNQPSMATEESDTHQTRGVYDDSQYAHMAPSDLKEGGASIEKTWKYYMERPYLAGLFLWTGFDYRGEENPFHFPAIASQYGVLDLADFPRTATTT